MYQSKKRDGGARANAPERATCDRSLHVIPKQLETGKGGIATKSNVSLHDMPLSKCNGARLLQLNIRVNSNNILKISIFLECIVDRVPNRMHPVKKGDIEQALEFRIDDYFLIGIRFFTVNKIHDFERYVDNFFRRLLVVSKRYLQICASKAICKFRHYFNSAIFFGLIF